MVATATLPVSKIKVRKGHNVRAETNGDPDFVESIRQLGVLVPLIIEQDGDDYYLVAGHRRLDAAQKAGLKEVPITVGGSEDREAVAAAENISRAQLNPVEEARSVERLLESGLTEKGVREVLGVSAKWVTQRKKILAIGDGWHEFIVDGSMTAAELDTLVAVYGVSPEFGDELLAYVKRQIKGGFSVDVGRGYTLDAAAAESKKFRTVGDSHSSGRRQAVTEPGLTKAAKDKLPTLVRKEYGFDYPWQPTWRDADRDRFRAAGVLIEAGDRDGWGGSSVVTDVELYRQVLSEKIENYTPPKKQSAKAAKGKAGETDADRRKREQRQKLNGELKELKAKAADLNHKLGVNLLNKLGTVELTQDVAEWLVTTCAAPSRDYTPQLPALDELAFGGLRYLLPDYQKVEERGKAKRKVTVYGEVAECGKHVKRFLAAAKQPGERVGRLLIVAAAEKYAIDAVVPQSQRWQKSHFRGDEKALARIAKPALPRGLEQTRKQIADVESKLGALKRN